MSEFTKTLIVDSTLQNPQYPYYRTIKEAADRLNGTYVYPNPPVPAIPGTIIVESGTYIIDGNNTQQYGDRRTVEISSNVTLIGRGNAVILLRGDSNGNNISAIKNKN